MGREAEAPIKPIDLYIFSAVVEETGATSGGKTYIKLYDIATRFWIANGTELKSGDVVKLMFHKEIEDALPSPAPIDELS